MQPETQLIPRHGCTAAEPCDSLCFLQGDYSAAAGAELCSACLCYVLPAAAARTWQQLVVVCHTQEQRQVVTHIAALWVYQDVPVGQYNSF
jgi:hypothetical protein